MRRRIRKRILDSLHTMKDAQEIAANMLLNGQSADAGSLLFQCQEGAQKIGESIEQSEGEGTGAVSCLETYCEILYQMSQDTDKERILNYQKQLGDILRQTENEVKEHLPEDRLKVVFLPYKASMWDCMESVWEAADADPECEALVVPIPYYEKNAQGSIVRECYEGDMFPKDVPVVHYRAYHLEEEQPDIVYIHNPYDGGNTVTTVHPDYYSSNLKKYTDLLVYIPYYICGNGPLPDCHLSLPAYEYVDYIILQDEEKVQNLADFVPMEKIAVLGTPKADRIRKLNRKKDEILEQEILQEWREKIRGKKVILYNISVTGLLRNSKYAMDKIRYVLSCFEGRDDVVLWWRPHPLLEATLHSALPALYEEYMKIKHAFAGSGNGILDETGDAAVAAVIADAYLGENTSSLMHYFGVQGKPVMYTNWEITEDNRKDREFLNVSTWYQEGDSIFFVPTIADMGHNLYQMNLEDGSMEKIMTFPGTSDHIWGCYYGIKKIQNKIILAPYNTEDIYIYDLDKRQGIKLVLSEAKDNMKLFDEIIEYKGKAFLLPGRYPALVRVDMETLEVCEYRECVKSFQRTNESEHMFQWAYYVNGEYLYLAGMNESRILIFNMEDESYKIKTIGGYPYGYCRLIYDGTCFWLGAFKVNRIVRWDEKSGNTKEYSYPMEQEPVNEWAYYGSLIDCGDEIKICSAFSFDIISFNKTTGECSRPEGIQDILAELESKALRNETGFVYARPWNGEGAVLFDTGNNCLHIWNLKTGQWKHYPCRLKKDDMLCMEKEQIEKYWISRSTPYCLWENQVAIAQFVDYIAGGDTKVFQQIYECYQEYENEIAAGRKIYDEMKKQSIFLGK